MKRLKKLHWFFYVLAADAVLVILVKKTIDPFIGGNGVIGKLITLSVLIGALFLGLRNIRKKKFHIWKDRKIIANRFVLYLVLSSSTAGMASYIGLRCLNAAIAHEEMIEYHSCAILKVSSGRRSRYIDIRFKGKEERLPIDPDHLKGLSGFDSLEGLSLDIEVRKGLWNTYQMVNVTF